LSPDFEIKNGRQPVIEKNNFRITFIANDVFLDETQLIMITGPICLVSHFASNALISLKWEGVVPKASNKVDKIFTRGARAIIFRWRVYIYG
jgi:hypothetical protein